MKNTIMSFMESIESHFDLETNLPEIGLTDYVALCQFSLSLVMNKVSEQLSSSIEIFTEKLPYQLNRKRKLSNSFENSQFGGILANSCESLKEKSADLVGTSSQSCVAENVQTIVMLQPDCDVNQTVCEVCHCSRIRPCIDGQNSIKDGWVINTLTKLLHCVISEKCVQDAGHLEISGRALLDYTWEKLNTGNWRDVPTFYRTVFTWASLGLVALLLQHLKSAVCGDNCGATKELFLKATEIVKVCDRGILMGSPMEDNPLHAVASSMNAPARLSTPFVVQSGNEESSCVIPDTKLHHPLSGVERPSLEKFILQFKNKLIPIKLLKIVDHWSALTKWNVGYLRRVAGARFVPVEIGARYTDVSWSQSLMPLDEYLTNYITAHNPNHPVGYLAQHQLLDQIPELRDDLSIPDYCFASETEQEPRLHAWIGPAGTVSPLHHDPEHNILVQVHGHKYIRLYTEDQTPFLYPYGDPLLSNTSQVDVEAEDIHRWPLLQEATFQDLILSPGESVYIPPRCWHYVRSLTTSISVSFWWN